MNDCSTCNSNSKQTKFINVFYNPTGAWAAIYYRPLSPSGRVKCTQLHNIKWTIIPMACIKILCLMIIKPPELIIMNTSIMIMHESKLAIEFVPNTLVSL